MDEVVGVGDEVPDGSVAELGFDHAGLTGDTDRFGRVEERIAETALFVDEVEREGLLASPNLAGGQGSDLVGGQMAAVGYVGDELAVHVVDESLEVGAFFGSHGVGWVAGILERANPRHDS